MMFLYLKIYYLEWDIANRKIYHLEWNVWSDEVRIFYSNITANLSNLFCWIIYPWKRHWLTLKMAVWYVNKQLLKRRIFCQLTKILSFPLNSKETFFMSSSLWVLEVKSQTDPFTLNPLASHSFSLSLSSEPFLEHV